MFRPFFIGTSVLLAGTSAFAQAPLEHIVPTPSKAAPIGHRSASVLPPAPIVGSDTCATPTVIAGFGPFNFDTTGATASPEGQATTNCIFSNQIGIDSDLWFDWTAPSTASFEVSTCQLTTVDTKIAVYTGASCPVPGGMAAGCADDLNISNGMGNYYQSRVTFAATAGTHYLIQLGEYPGQAQGAGQFSIGQVPVQPPFARDDGASDDALRAAAGCTDTLWLMAQGNATTGTVNVNSIKAATGSALFPGQTGVVNGNPIMLGVWEDPNDDSDPSDAILVASFTATVSQTDTDVLVQYNLPTPVAVTGVFFVGAAYSHGAGMGFPAPIDANGCNARSGQAWFAGNIGPVNFANLLANTVPVVSSGGVVANNPTNDAFLLEASTGTASTGTIFCIGDGVTPHTACPCANNSATADQVGCLSSLGVGGKLRGTGTVSLTNDTLVLNGSLMPNSSVLYFQGTIQQSGGNGAVFGDGLRCAGGVVIRLGSTTNVGGSSMYPFGAAPAVHVKGAVTVPSTRTYQGWYRNAAAFCTTSTFNLTNGLEISWTP